jgi:hypothetical protein
MADREHPIFRDADTSQITVRQYRALAVHLQWPPRSYRVFKAQLATALHCDPAFAAWYSSGLHPGTSYLERVLSHTF